MNRVNIYRSCLFVFAKIEDLQVACIARNFIGLD